jgi:uncharacterized protein (DUF2236 family)
MVVAHAARRYRHATRASRQSFSLLARDRGVVLVPLPDVTRPLRRAVRAGLRATVASTFRGERDPVLIDTDADPGLFGPESVTWRVHADLAMFIGGLRALIAQTMHPLAMAGVADHSRYRDDPLGRLARTSAFVVATTYGTTAEADRAIALVRRVHAGVHGIAPDGRPYSALDPDLLAWVHHVEVDSFLAAYQAFGPRRLLPPEADRYVEEMAALGARMGVPAPARSTGELRDWLASVEGLRATREARDAVRFLVLPSIPRRLLPAYGVVAAAAVSLVPLRDRVALWLPPTPIADRVLVRPAARSLLTTLRFALGSSPTLAAARARVDGAAA